MIITGGGAKMSPPPSPGRGKDHIMNLDKSFNPIQKIEAEVEEIVSDFFTDHIMSWNKSSTKTLFDPIVSGMEAEAR